MIPLKDKTNVNSPNGTWPYGELRDNPGDNSGTPVDEALVSDVMQLMEAVMADAGITANGLLDNLANGFQLYTAFTEFVRNKQATEALKGTAEIATQAETDAGTDDERMITALKLKNTPSVMGVDGSVKLRTKIVAISDWNMATTATKSVAHGIADFKKIVDVTARIRNDANSVYEPLMKINTTTFTLEGGVSTTGSASVILARAAGGFFDDNAYSTNPGARGIMVVTYMV